MTAIPHFMTLYYDARNPKRVIDAGWYFEPLFLASLGLLVFPDRSLLQGNFGFRNCGDEETGCKGSGTGRKHTKQDERVANGLFPSIGGLIFILFGVLMVVTRHNHWMWIFVGLGILAVLYFSMDMVPAMLELHQLKVAKKFKGKVVDTDNFDKDSERRRERESKRRTKINEGQEK